jgi:ribonucleoside-diphosphate reductase alpha chain
LDLDDAAAEADVDTLQRAAAMVDGPVTAPVEPASASSPAAALAPTGSNGTAGSSGSVKTMASVAMTTTQATRTVDAGTASMQSALSEMMGDAPLCDVCGHITVRNGSCFKCLNCGNSLGCS